MKKNANPNPNAGNGQVFELTMDNPEDQDELNRRLSKSSTFGRAPVSGIKAAPSVKKKVGKRKGTS